MTSDERDTEDDRGDQRGATGAHATSSLALVAASRLLQCSGVSSHARRSILGRATVRNDEGR